MCSIILHNSSVRRRKGVVDAPNVREMTLQVKPEVYSRVGAAIKDMRHYMENHRQHLVYSFMFFFACGLVFAERFYSEYKAHHRHCDTLALWASKWQIERHSNKSAKL